MNRRHYYFAASIAAIAAALHGPLWDLTRLSLARYEYSHLIVIPFISAAVIYLDRRRIFAQEGIISGAAASGTLCAAGLLSVLAALVWIPTGTGRLSFMAMAAALLAAGAFAGCYGARALRAAMFPLLFLVLMIPLPEPLLNGFVAALQRGSADVAYAIFRLVGAPVLRDGFVFSLPGVNIEVAAECSGIRSCEALLIVCLLAGHYFLRSSARKLVFLLAVVPVAIIKNAIRIATISLLSVYVDRGFLTGRLHHDGGVPFSMIAVAMLLPLLWGLQKGERRPQLLAPAPELEPAAVAPASRQY